MKPMTTWMVNHVDSLRCVVYISALGDCPQDVQRVQLIPDEYMVPMRELSGPRPLHREANIVSRSLIWDLKMCIVYCIIINQRHAPRGLPSRGTVGVKHGFRVPSPSRGPLHIGAPKEFRHEGWGAGSSAQGTGGGACSPPTTRDPRWNPQRGPLQSLLLLIGIELVLGDE